MAKSSTSFKKGQTGNPNGRPVGSFSLTAMLRDELQNIPEGEDKKTYAEMLVRRVLKMAIADGNEQMIKLCWNYLEGLPKETHQMEGDVHLHFHKSLENADTPPLPD